MAEQNGLRLQVYLARSGVASRRKSEEIILQGRVRVNGTVIREMGSLVQPGDRVQFDGRPVYPQKRLIYLAVHKPRRYLCTSSDPQGRPLALDLVAPAFRERLFTVGRLDFLSSGLIFFSNDGQFAKAVSHPSSGVEKEYLVETPHPVPSEFLKRYQEGIQIKGETYHLKDFSYHNARTVRLVLEEGKNREIRTVFESDNITIKRLHRIRIGQVTVKGIQPGHYRSLTRTEIGWFYQKAGMQPPGKEVRDRW
jgi:23S rRNA pseudouridine2605 synthase